MKELGSQVRRTCNTCWMSHRWSRLALLRIWTFWRYSCCLGCSGRSPENNDLLIITRDLANTIRAICFRRSLSSMSIERAEMNPAMKAFFLSSLQYLLIMHRNPLYNAFKSAANNANRTASKFYLRFTLKTLLLNRYLHVLN